MKKIFVIMIITLSMTMCFAGCNSEKSNIPNNSVVTANSDNTEKQTDNTEKQKVNIADITWNVDEKIVDGERYVLLDYTNNTPYTISEFKITFNEKDGLTEEEKTSFYADIQKNFKTSNEDMDSIKNRSISMHAKADKVVNPGESVSNVNCYYFDGVFYLKDINHYRLVDPDIATVKYIDENKIFTVYYDYVSKKYSTEEDTEIAYQWTKTNLGNKIPKPDVKRLESGRNDDEIFRFEAFGLTLEQFNAYVEDCKKLGYTVEPLSHEGFYSADNKEGYNIYLYYEKSSYSMNGTIEAPETKNE